jgi:hypothetical protein
VDHLRRGSQHAVCVCVRHMSAAQFGLGECVFLLPCTFFPSPFGHSTGPCLVGWFEGCVEC